MIQKSTICKLHYLWSNTIKNIFYHNEHSYQLAVLLEPLREEILKRWENDRVSGHVLKLRNIDQHFFVRHFGSKVLDYFIKVLNNQESVGNCPVMIVMIQFFAKKKLTLQNLFLCCAGFKNSVSNVFTEFSLKSTNAIDFEKLRALQVVFDLNFSGVIQEYITYGYCAVECPEKLNTKKFNAEVIDFNAIEKELLSFSENCELKTYSDSYGSDEIQEFSELEDEITFHIEKILDCEIVYQSNCELSSKLTKYANTILINPSFHSLGESLFELAHMFSNESNLPSIEQSVTNLATLLDCFVNDLILWRESLLSKGIQDPHYFDQSIISNVQQITTIVLGSQNSDEGFELF